MELLEKGRSFFIQNREIMTTFETKIRQIEKYSEHFKKLDQIEKPLKELALMFCGLS